MAHPLHRQFPGTVYRLIARSKACQALYLKETDCQSCSGLLRISYN